MEISLALDKRLREICHNLNITISALAIQAGLSPTTLLDIKRVKKVPNFISIIKVCDGINMKLADFFNSPHFDKIDYIE